MSHVRFDVVKKNATIPDTLNLIIKAIGICQRSPFVKQLTAQLNPTGDKYAFVKRLFDYVCKNVPYVLDTPGDEEVWTPELTLKEGRGDCKKMTVLIASVLAAAGIEPVIKHVYYTNSTHTHVYVIVPWPDLDHYLTVDPVNHKMWDTEVTGIKSSSLHFLNGKKMDLHMMGSPGNQVRKVHFHRGHIRPIHACVRGIDDEISFVAGMGTMGAKDQVLASALTADFGITGMDEDEIMNGISGMGKRHHKTAAEKKAKQEKRKARRKKLFGFFKKGTMAPTRAAFLLLVRTNVFKLANRIAKLWVHNPNKVKDLWKQWGGNPNKLKAAVKHGAGRKNKALADKVQGIAGMAVAPSVADLEAMEMNGTMGYIEGIGSATAIAAAIAAATPLVVAFIKLLGKSKDDQDTSEEVDTAAEGVQQSAQNFADQGEQTQGIGYMSDADDIVSGEGSYDYIDGMGRKRKKNKGAKKEKRKAKRKARRAKKKEGQDGEGGSDDQQSEESESITSRIRRSVPIHDEDIKTLSTLAEYGANKILKGQVKMEDIQKFGNQDGGTEDTPLSTPKHDEDDEVAVPQAHAHKMIHFKGRPPVHSSADIPSEVPAAGNFGLTQINSLPTFLHWIKGAMVIAFAGGCGLTLLSDAIIVGSLLYLTRKQIFSIFKFKKS